MQNIFWIDLNRFDENISKAPRLEISEALIENGFNITLLTGYRKRKYYSQYYRVRIKYFKAIQLPGFFRLSLMFLFLLWILQHSKKDDIVILPPAALWIGLLLKFFGDCKIHLDVRSVPVEIHSLKKKAHDLIFWSLPLKLFNNIPDGYSFITELLKDKIEKEINSRYNNYVIWHSGVNIDHFRIVRKHSHNTYDTFKITYLGVITRNRGLDRVIYAISELNEKYKNKFFFNVIGDGPFLNDLKKISADLGVTGLINFQGYVAYESVPKHLVDTDIFICPLPERIEWNISSPIKVYEYLACAKPVILTPIKAHTNIIRNAKYIIYTHGDAISDFKIAIEYAYKNREYLQIASKDALSLIKEHFEWSAQGRKFAQYLHETLKATN